MKQELNWIWNELRSVEQKRVFIYVVIYFAWGNLMDWFGTTVEIARFENWWQIITCYILYMIPISIVLRNQKWHTQYAYGLVAMGLLEFGGYALESSYAYPGNLIDQFFNERNFSLAMALFFAFYFPLGNELVDWVYRLAFAKKEAKA